MIEEYSIISLVLLYLAVNVWYRNLKSILLFLVSLVVLYPMVQNKLYAVVIAYVISIGFNIVKNFHLLENFSGNENQKNKTKNNESETPIIIPSNLQELKKMSTLMEKTSKSDKIPKNNNIENENNASENEQSYYFDDEMVSDALITRFVDMLERKGRVKITNSRISPYKLKPTISTLDSESVEHLRGEVEYNNPQLLEKVVTISRDNYILNGHYTWYLKKMFLSEKNENTLVDIKYTDSINIKKIDMEIEPLIKKLEDYKIEFNENAKNKFTVDKKKLKDLRANINSLKNTIKNLEKHYKELSEIRVN